MNNYERIKSMTVDEMAKYLADVNYENDLLCSGCKENKHCTYFNCIKHIKQWLLSEVEDE